MTSIIIESAFVSGIRYDENNTSTDIAWHKSEFVEAWTGLDYSTFWQINYEPSRDLYHIIETDMSVTVLSDPSEDDRMQYVADNADAMWDWLIAAEAAWEEAQIAAAEAEQAAREAAAAE